MLDFTKAIEVAKDIYWIGKYLEGDPFQCHPYLILNGEESVIVDPGSILEYDDLIKKITSLIPMKNIKYIIAHHQDPDICAAIPNLEKLIDRDDLNIITHKRTASLIKHYGITSKYLYIDDIECKLMLSDERSLEFVQTPYAHAPGAFVTYDILTKTLFSSDIFGSIAESWQFYADESYFDKIKLFHEEYMPSREILNYAIKRMESLDLELILPQHGSIIKKEYIADIFDKLKKLDCGIYINAKYRYDLLKQKDDLELEKNTYKENIEQLKTIIDMQDNIIVVTLEHTIVHANMAFLNFFGKSNIDEFMSENKCMCDRFITVDDGRYISSETCMKNCTEYILEHSDVEHRVMMKNHLGDTFIFKIQVKEITSKDEIKYHIISFIDITKDAQELDLLQILSNVDDVHYFIYDKNRQKYKTSFSLAGMFDFGSEGDIKNIDFKKHMSKTDYLKLLKSIGKNSSKFEITINYNEKTFVFLVQNYESYIEKSMKLVYILVDISVIREIESKSKQRDILMFQQSKMAQMGEMISMIAHQWRQPINAISASSIKLSLSNTLGNIGSDEIEEHAEFVQKQCQKMSKVIDSFMSYSNSRTTEKNFHVQDVIHTINEFVSVQYTAHNIKVLIECDSSLDDTVYGRKDMLEQVLLNLLSNAKDALEDAPAELDKSIWIRYNTPNVIVVEDNAGGIDDAILDKLFVPYFTTKEQGKGTGLGLYMSKRIMNEHFNGDITYKKIGDKSSFTITF